MNRKLLLIDDEVDLVEEIADWLAARGIDARVAGSGQEGLAAAAAERPDLIICDISMPGMDGYQVLERVRAMPAPISTTPFIFLTAHAAIEDEIKGRGFGADDYVAKPVDLPRLLAVIGSRLAQADRFETAARERIQLAQDRITKSSANRMAAMEQAFIDLRPLMREASGATVQLISLMEGIADQDWIELGASAHDRLKTAQTIIRRAGILAAVPPPPKNPRPQPTSLEEAVGDATNLAAARMRRGGTEILSEPATVTADPESLRCLLAAFLVWSSENVPRARIAATGSDSRLLLVMSSEHRTPQEILARWTQSCARSAEPGETVNDAASNAADAAAGALIDAVESHGGTAEMTRGDDGVRVDIRLNAKPSSAT